MNSSIHPLESDLSVDFKAYQQLMSVKIREILLVSSPYDAFIIEEDGSLASRIINEYRGLNLSMPPRIIRTSSAREALDIIAREKIDMVITMPHIDDMDAFTCGLKIKAVSPHLPVILLTHSLKGVYPLPENRNCSGIDKIYVWTGNSDLLLALVKNAEDRLNVEKDTLNAKVRVLILVEDSPIYRSNFLPMIYKVIVNQTQGLMVDGINEEHRLLKMRARPKILAAENFEEALVLYEKYKSYLLGILSDTRIPKNGEVIDDAGIILLSHIKRNTPDLPLLLMSSDPLNRERAAKIPAVFLDKNSPNLTADLTDYFLTHLGFGDFVFRLPDGTEVGRATDLQSLEEKIVHIPAESLWYHARGNHFSNWIMARSEIALGSEFRAVEASSFKETAQLREYIISGIRRLRRWRQGGVVAQFDGRHFDPEMTEFVKIGQGSLGGKGRSLAFMAQLLHQQPEIYQRYTGIRIRIPRTLVIATGAFEAFMKQNKLGPLAAGELEDEEIAARFLAADLPAWLIKALEAFLAQVAYPLSVRSSSLLEDTHFLPYAGLYQTYMIPNNHEDFSVRLHQMATAVKLVYASAFYEGPRQFSRRTKTMAQDEAMAVLVQELTGETHGDFFYPTLSGVAQSHNFYPFGPMKPEDGIATIALGFGKTVVEGERALRFAPGHPQILPQYATVDDTLKNSQRMFYALKIRGYADELKYGKDSNLVKRDVSAATGEYPVKLLSATYIPDEHRLRDSGFFTGPKVLTFAQVLKYDLVPLPGMITDFLKIGRRGMGCPVEIEFSLNLSADKKKPHDFCFLQMRPMVGEYEQLDVKITADEDGGAFCRSNHALGNGEYGEIRDIVLVRSADLNARETPEIAEEIGRLNAKLTGAQRPYLLIGPGRWGSSDPWLGIPVRWQNISGVGALIELKSPQVNVEASQGSHFFQNITSLGIPYITVDEAGNDFLDRRWLDNLPEAYEKIHLRHIRLAEPLLLKIDGRSSRGVILKEKKRAHGG